MDFQKEAKRARRHLEHTTLLFERVCDIEKAICRKFGEESEQTTKARAALVECHAAMLEATEKAEFYLSWISS